jgi:hypothetical protein
MDFSKFVRLYESTALELYKSTVEAFPRTTRRQNSIDMIKIIEMSYLPYLGMRTLFVKGLAKNIENQREYKTILLFKNVVYSKSEGRNTVKFIGSDRKKYLIETLNADKHDVLVRCDCPDFFWRFNHYNSLDGSLHGRKRRKYESKKTGRSVNESKAPGLCKHLIKTIKAVTDSKIMEE